MSGLLTSTGSLVHSQHAPDTTPAPRAFVTLCDANLQTFWVSPEFEAITGYTPAEVIGRKVSQLLLGPNTDADMISQLRTQIALRKNFTGELLCYTKDQTPYWVNLSLSPIFNSSGDFQHFLAIHSVNTQAEFIEAQTQVYVERLERQRNVLIREVHHRIKNSLQGVAGMLRQHAQANSWAAPILDKAIAQIRTVAVVHGLEGKALYNEVVLCEMAPSIARMVQELILPAGQVITVRVNVPERIRVSEPERVPVALILNELILNAAKHLKENGSDRSLGVSVVWNDDNECACITITNPGQLPSHFDFANDVGTGTGLELVHSMLPAQGAELLFTNRQGFVETRLTLCPPVIYSVSQKQ